jgi:hypothetical protein
MMLAIPEKPPATKDGYGNVNKDAHKDRDRENSGRDQPPKQTHCTGCAFTGPGSVAYFPAAIQAAVLGEKERHGHAREEAADYGEGMIAAALGAGFHHNHRSHFAALHAKHSELKASVDARP